MNPTDKLINAQIELSLLIAHVHTGKYGTKRISELLSRLTKIFNLIHDNPQKS